MHLWLFFTLLVAKIDSGTKITIYKYLRKLFRGLKAHQQKSIVHVIKHDNFNLIGYILKKLFRKPDNSRQIYKKTSSTFHTSNMCLKRVEKKKLLGRHNKVAKWLFNFFFLKKKKQPPEVFYKKALLLKTSQYSQKEQENTCVGVSL